MKKNIPYLIPISFESNSGNLEDLIFWRFENMIDEGYRFPKHDFDLYCAILLRNERIENLSKDYQNYLQVENKIRDEV